ncbi:MAG TPA: hypothetical protein VN456_16200 [Desulfosporosinus sp.]|nr:hypothetical protein [Desulfosporosinus sp.]
MTNTCEDSVFGRQPSFLYVSVHGLLHSGARYAVTELVSEECISENVPQMDCSSLYI